MGVTINEDAVMNVPSWNAYYPELKSANKQQRDFYIYWVNNIEKGNLIDVKGNLSYIFVYLYSVVEKFIKTRDITWLKDKISLIEKGYGKIAKVSTYLNSWMGDAYIWVGDYDNAWEYLRMRKISVNDVVSFRNKCTNTILDGIDIISLLGSKSRIKKYTDNEKNLLIQCISSYMTDFQEKHNQNVIEHFCSKLNYVNLSEDDFAILQQYYPSEKTFLFWKNNYKKRSCEGKKWLFAGMCYSDSTLKLNTVCTYHYVPNVISVAIEYEIMKVLSNCKKSIKK